MKMLGLVLSFSRASVSDDNPYTEDLFSTLKFTRTYPRKRFEDLKQARTLLQAFLSWHKTQNRHSGIQFVPPEQIHAGQDREILLKRKAVSNAAKCSKTRCWKS
jgi:putative transposase